MKKYIVSDPDIHGGIPVITGTRVPVEIILYRLKEGYTIKKISNLYPWVGLRKLEKVLDELAQKVSRARDDKTFLQT